MNMQAMLKQAQKLKNDMEKTQKEINAMTFEGKSSLVDLKIDGLGNLIYTKINADSLEKDDIEMLEDMFIIAYKEAKEKKDKVTEEKMGVYTNGIPGLF